MRKILVCLVIAAAFIGMSCKTAPDSSQTGENSGPQIVGDVTQEKVNEALDKIYDTYRTRLDLSNAQEYTVASGDTLNRITRQFYGNLTGVGDAGSSNGFYFPVIMLASDHSIVDPDQIEPGMKLRIPDLKKNLDNPISRGAIKDCLNEVAYIYNRKGVAATEEGLKKLASSL